MRIVAGLAAVTLGAAALLLLMVWAGQRRLMYFPADGPLPTPRGAGLPTAREVVLHTEDGVSLGAWFVEPAAAPIGWTLLLLNGNGGHRAYRAPLAARLAEHGIATLMLDYRGYGGNPGTPSEEGLARDARAARRWLDGQISAPMRIAYFGESLGAAVAVRLAVERMPDALILRSPFDSMAGVAGFHYPVLPARWLLRDRYPSDARIGAVTCPTLIIAAERDTVVPVTLSRRLFDLAPPAHRGWLLVPGADHNDFDALAGDTLVAGVLRFLR